nr:uncharacterized protein LOC104103895 [Nicotiana tomentosiformis]
MAMLCKLKIHNQFYSFFSSLQLKISSLICSMAENIQSHKVMGESGAFNSNAISQAETTESNITKKGKKRFPILAEMARDVLAVSVSSVASECAFSTGGRLLDSFRSSLTPKLVQALVCLQDWLRNKKLK